MSENKLGTDPVFAKGAFYHPESGADSPQKGISKRLWIATQIAAGTITRGYMNGESMIENVYKITDELLRQENL